MDLKETTSKMEENVELKTKTDYMKTFREKKQKNNSPQKDKKLGEKIKEVVREVGEFSLIAGMSNIIRSELPVRIAWITFQLILLAVALYLVAFNIQNYLKHEVITKIREVNEFPSYFPTISLCNLNYFTTDYSIQYLKSISESYDLKNIFNSSDYNQSDYSDLINSYQNIGASSVIISNLNKSEILRLGYTMEEALISCSFGGYYCSYKDFAWFFHPNYG